MLGWQFQQQLVLKAEHLEACSSLPRADASLPPHRFNDLLQRLSSRHPLSFLSEISGDAYPHRVPVVIHMVS